ncbi:zinc finger BED domain-containing protein RICESLEEPER 2-like [Arachis hypogaea]|uniref:zinc finger BED domain-containing protein RICESLEEPER 2-like n=1 Tax=Arachis hypogaea TaxID=3818 RepID=UPI000DEC8D8F
MEDWNLHPLKGEHLHVRCGAHILNLVVNDELKEMHESSSKIRNAIRYVRASPSHMNRFKNFIKEARIQDKCTVQLNVPTRWNSTYTMLESGLKFQKVFKMLREKDTEYALMQGGIPKNLDWDNTKYFTEFLKIFHEVIKSVSGSLLVTSSQYFHEICKILRVFKASCGSRDPLLGSMAERMKLKYDKYWIPDGDMTGDFFEEVHLHEIINKNEVNSNKYPILSQIAKDVLAMPVSIVASELAFSTGERVLHNYRSSLTPNTIEALICTQNWFRTSPITTNLEELIEEFEKLELDKMKLY